MENLKVEQERFARDADFSKILSDVDATIDLLEHAKGAIESC